MLMLRVIVETVFEMVFAGTITFCLAWAILKLTRQASEVMLIDHGLTARLCGADALACPQLVVADIGAFEA
jgi:hypothetical protein